jgi:hypothetical protein
MGRFCQSIVEDSPAVEDIPACILLLVFFWTLYIDLLYLFKASCFIPLMYFCKVCFAVKLMIHYLAETCDYSVEILWFNTPVSVYGDGSAGATGTNRALAEYGEEVINMRGTCFYK